MRTVVTLDRPLIVAVEARFPIVEVEALEPFLEKFAGLVRSGVMSCPGDTREPLLAGLDRFRQALKERQPPFEE